MHIYIYIYIYVHVYSGLAGEVDHRRRREDDGLGGSPKTPLEQPSTIYNKIRIDLRWNLKLPEMKPEML